MRQGLIAAARIDKIVNEKGPNPIITLSPLVLDRGFGVQFRGDHVHVELGKDFKVEPANRQDLWNVIGDACAA